ncbi:hypothetical protein [Vagococcus sp. CY53-2]|uniref:lipopolysaccharide biosynthesis protein n=1 Tax=Vagococcus sp. CY53-2 TaxID=2925780 RepID=UPI001F50DDF5|nr:hypothetical protein [Vagococcus sp. CY53-2]MCI0130541.1 hypothetical protein [Vagococcus sp. CY53-2]
MKKKFIKDVMLNTISNFLLLAIVQLVIFPYFNMTYGFEKFGEITAIYGLNSIFLVYLGDSLNNVKIIHQKTSGDNFNILSLFAVSVSLILSLIVFNIYGIGLQKVDIIIFSIATSLGVFRVYLGSNLRIKLNYINILLTNIFVFLGYVIGLFVFKLTHYWSLIFFIGELSGVLFLIKKTDFFKQSFKWNAERKIVMRDYLNLSTSYGINGVSNYLDRILIIPILGATSMSVFYAASVVSKIIIMLLGQFNTVFLAYFMKRKKEINRNNILKFQFLLSILLLTLYYPILFVSKISIKILYGNMYDKTMDILPFITLGILFYSMANFLKIFILKYFDLKIQLNIQIFYTVLYVIFAFIFSSNYGLKGFSISYCIMGLISTIMYVMVIIFFKTKENN